MRYWRLKNFGVALLVVSGLTIGGDARADAIDGTWCHGARTIHIDGPDIRTPGGKSLKGDYDRHGFAYVGPKGDYWAGLKIVMSLLDDETLELKAGEKGTPTTWRRCKPTI